MEKENFSQWIAVETAVMREKPHTNNASRIYFYMYCFPDFYSETEPLKKNRVEPQFYLVPPLEIKPLYGGPMLSSTMLQ